MFYLLSRVADNLVKITIKVETGLFVSSFSCVDSEKEGSRWRNPHGCYVG